MRLMIALLLSLPIYQMIGFEDPFTLICLIGLQIMAGINLKLGIQSVRK